MLALGRLSTVLLQAWRGGDFEKFTGYNGSVADIVRAFTLAPSAEEQDRQIGKLLDLVGIKAYTAAGGSLVEDLFGENDAVSTPRWSRSWLRRSCPPTSDELLKDGWSWVSLADELPSTYSGPGDVPKPTNAPPIEDDPDFDEIDDKDLDEVA
jgi:hypothetical protein